MATPLLIVVVFEAVALADGLKLSTASSTRLAPEWLGSRRSSVCTFFALARLWEIPAVNWLAAAVVGCGLVGCVLAFAGAGLASVDAVAGVLTGAVLLGFSGAAGTHDGVVASVSPDLRRQGRPGCLTVAVSLMALVACTSPAGEPGDRP